MTKKLALAAVAALGATPVAAATKNPFSAEFDTLTNTDFVVAIAFILFIGVLVYFGVPKLIGKLLDDRAAGNKAALDELGSAPV